MMLKLFIFCALLAVAFARSTGAPISACGSMNPIGHMKSGFTAQDLAFTVSVEPASNGLFDVTVSGPANFRGVFIQVRRSGTAMGNFVNPPENYKLIDCFDSSDSALTHSNGGDKGTSVTARWQAPDDCSGTLTVMATVVVSFTTFQTGITTTLDCTTTTATTEAPPPPPPVTTTESPPPPPPPTTTTTTTTTMAPTTTTTVAPTTTTTTTMAPTTTTTTTEEVETTEEMVEMEGFEEGRSIEINQPSPEPPAITTTTEETTTKGGMGMMCKHDNMTKLPENKYKTKFNMVPYNGWMNTGKPRYVSTSYGRGYVRPTWKKAVEFEAGGKKNFYMRMGGKSLVRGDMVSLHTRYELRGCFCVHLSFRMPVAGNRLTVLSYLKPLKSMKQRQTTWKKMSVQVDSKRTTMIRVVATRGMKRSASVEVDNLYIMKGMCDKPQYQG